MNFPAIAALEETAEDKFEEICATMREGGTFVEAGEPTFENIAAGDYPVSHSLFFYVKNAHVGVIPRIQEYVTGFTSEGAYGEDGYLTDKGLIPLPEDERNAARESATSLTPMS